VIEAGACPPASYVSSLPINRAGGLVKRTDGPLCDPAIHDWAVGGGEVIVHKFRRAINTRAPLRTTPAVTSIVFIRLTLAIVFHGVQDCKRVGINTT
jgi:hypothetical protein